MKFDHNKARAALSAHHIGEVILAYQEREEIPLDSAIDDAQCGRLGGEVAEFANSLPSFWVEEDGEAARQAAQKAAQDRAMQALRPAQAAINAKILAMVQERKLFVWETEDGSGVEYKDSAKQELDAALERVLSIYLPLLEGTGWNREIRAVVPRADVTQIERVVSDDRAQKEAARIARLRATA